MGFGPLSPNPLGGEGIGGDLVVGDDATIADDLTVTDDVTADTVTARRFIASSDTAMQSSDVALSAGWGTTASVAVATGSTSQRFRLTITSAGTGQGANPTTTVTFPGGAFATGARAIVRYNGGTGASPTNIFWTQPTTTIVITHVQTPVDGLTYSIDCIIMG